MDKDPLDIIWQSSDDKRIYYVVCRRVTDRSAMLELIRLKDREVVRSESVSLAYGARFGPDFGDIRTWNRMATQWSDELDGTSTQYRGMHT